MGSVARRKATDPWVRTAADKRAVREGCYFDPAAAEHVCDFFEAFLRHSIGEWVGKPFELQPWQRDWLSPVFGWKRPDGYRRFRESYVEIAKKNGKSALCSGIALYGLLEEPGAQVRCGALNSEQAHIVFDEAARMVRASPDLADLLDIWESKNTVVYPEANAKLKAMSADADSKDGGNLTLAILDEVHHYKNTRLYDMMKYAGRARKQPLLLSITTAGFDKNSLCYSLHKRAVDILEGKDDDIRFLPVIYAADRDKDDLDDPATWRKANPSLGVIFSEEDFAADLAEAKRIPGRLNNFLRLSLDIWTEQETRWLDVDLWDAGLEVVEPEQLLQKECFAAIDCSTVKDLTSIALAFVEGDLLRTVNYFFMPADTARERSERDGVPYLEWIEQGWMIETPGNATDFRAIREKLEALAGEHLVLKVGLDPWNAAQLASDLMEAGFDVVEIRQGYRTLTAPSKELERRLLNGTIRHDGNPAQRWCIQNVATETDAAGNIKPSKKASTERIDGVVALVMSIGLATAPPDPRPAFTVL
jgi:phage terminase large subunit-like protein